MSTTSEILNRAADLIRDTAARATQGTWSAKDMAEHGHSGVWWVEAEHRDADGTTWGTVADLETTNPKNDARWIALMSPAVAPALEAWLRQAADELRQHRSEWRHRMGGSARSQGEINDLVERYFGHALDFARAVLGVQEDGENW